MANVTIGRGVIVRPTGSSGPSFFAPSLGAVTAAAAGAAPQGKGATRPETGLLGFLDDLALRVDAAVRRAANKPHATRFRPCPTCSLPDGVDADDSPYTELAGPLFGPKGPQPHDLSQGVVGDCWLLATMMSIAKVRPDLIKKMIETNPDGTYTVTFQNPDEVAYDPDGRPYWVREGTIRTVVRPRVPGILLWDSQKVGPPRPTPLNVTDTGDGVWPEVLEKAFAQTYGGKKGYDGLEEIGQALFAMQKLTDGPAGSFFTHDDSLTFERVRTEHEAGALMVAGTGREVTAPNMEATHAYAVQRVYRDAQGDGKIELLDPHNGKGHDTVTLSWEDFRENVHALAIGKPKP